MKPSGRPLTGGKTAWIFGLALLCSLAAVRTMPWTRVMGYKWGDTLDHVGLIQAAADGLKEGQFPLLEAPRVFTMIPPVYHRAAHFQFNSNLPSTLAGLATLAGLNPWHTFLVFCFLAFFSGFLGVFFLASQMEVEEGPALAAAALYSLAPCHLTALFFRGAFAELMVFGILPWVALFSIRAGRKPSPKAVALSGLAWACLMLTHHVFHLWTVVFLAPAMLLEKFLRRKPGFSLAHAGLGYGLGLALSAWFVLPGALVGSHFLQYGNQTTAGCGFTPLFDLKILLAHPWVSPWLGINEAGLNVYHIGWPILAGVILALVRQKKALARQPFFWLLAASLLLAWGPFVYWKAAGPLQMIQFKFRLLIYVGLFGCVLCGLGLAGLNRAKGRALAVGLIFFQAWFHAPYQQASPLAEDIASLAQNVQSRGIIANHPPYLFVIPAAEADRMDQGSDLEAASSRDLKSFHLEDGLDIMGSKGAPKGRAAPGIWTSVFLSGVEPGSLAVLPAPWYPGLYRLEINGQKTGYGRVEDRLAARLPPGDVELRYRLSGYVWANWLSLAAWILLAGFYILWILKGRRRKA